MIADDRRGFEVTLLAQNLRSWGYWHEMIVLPGLQVSGPIVRARS